VPNVLMQLADDLRSGALEVVDLTQPLGPDTVVIGLPPMFASSPGVSIEVISKYDEKGPAWYWNALNFGEHTGTHFDAPVHWITGRDLPQNACDTIPAERFIGPACVIDVSREAHVDNDFLLMPAHVEEWERQHGKIPPRSWVLLRTDWSLRRVAGDFLNMDEEGPHTPGFHPSTSQLLAKTRDVLGVGVETVGTDAGQAGKFDPPFPNHGIMHGAGKFGLASLCNLDRLPPTGSIVIAAPLKIVNGSGSPLRVLAIVPRR
jgi:isatin hydrolase